MAYKNTVKDYSQMIGYLTRDKTTDVPGSMAHGLRIGLYDGGRAGFKKGRLATTLTPQMVIDIAEDNPNFTATDIVNKLEKDKTKNYVTAKGTPINRQVINKTLSETFDLAAAEKSKVPKGYISSQEFFNTEGIPIANVII